MLSIDDMAIDSHEAPSHVTIHLKHLKTDPFGAGFTLHLGYTGDDLYPIVATLDLPCSETSRPRVSFSLSGWYTSVTDPSLPRAEAGSDSSGYRHSRV